MGVDVQAHDIDPDRLRALVDAVDGVALSNRDAAEVDFVVIATPTAQHIEDLEWALGRGLGAFVEKPLGATRRDLDRARQLTATDSVVMVGCNLRFTEGFRCLEENIGRVGSLLSVEAEFGWYLPAWRPGQDYRHSYSASRALGGGVILDATHEIDYVVSLAGRAVSVAATWTNTGTLELDVEDLAEVTLRHQGGALSQIHLDYLQRSYTRNCRLVGTDATLHWDYAAGTVHLHGPGGSEALLEDADRDDNQMYVAEMTHFLEAVNTGAATANGLDAAIATLHVALTALDRGAES